MIKNERQYKITKNQVKKFEHALAQLRKEKGEKKGIHPLLIEAQKDALRSQLDDLRNQIKEYELLLKGKHKVLKVLKAKSIEEMPRTLIQARIALGLSQKELAERLDLKEQQIQRYESTDYASASLSRIIDVVHALNLKVHKNVYLPAPNRTFEYLLSRLKGIGINRDFVFSRLIPTDIVALSKIEGSEENEDSLVSRTATAIERVFGWGHDYLLSNKPLELDYRPMVRFKLPKRRSQTLNAYTVYAHYLALITLDSTRFKQKKISLDPIEVKKTILANYGSVTFKNVLQYVWDLGVPVLPLNDPGAFHGACWRVNSSNIIVIKQQALFLSRWAFDLLHELYHAGQEPEKDNYDVIELDDTNLKYKKSDEEIAASRFAGDVLLGGRAEELTDLCVDLAKGKVEWLKNAVQTVSKKEKVEIEYLANYIAFRLSLQGLNWWGAANNLQSTKDNPWKIARDMLLQNIDFSRINETDQKLIMLAMSETEA